MEIILDHNAVAMVSVCNTPFFKAKIPSIVELEDGTDQLGQMKWALKPYTLKPYMYPNKCIFCRKIVSLVEYSSHYFTCPTPLHC